ncbi:hypothetical protein CsSME_00045413 [Camellia sinensis var. sinensis]
MSQNELVYLEALKASETTEAPGIGLTISSDKLSIPSGVKTLIRQNNTIIELCLRLSKQVEALEGRIRALEAQKSPALSTDDLVAKIANLSLGPKEKPKEGKGLLRVHRDPNKLLQAELDKLRLKNS